MQNWWIRMQSKGATKLYAIQDGSIYRLRAFTDNRKKCGELSLGLRDKRLAQRIAVSMAVTIDDNSPASVINKYIEHLKLHKKACETGKYILTTLAQSAEHNLKTIKSRLSAHLVPFCKKRHISDINDMYRREIIRAYGAKRVLFGTDYPMWRQPEEIGSLLKLDLTDEEYRRLFWDNAQELFGI
jgi:hypothetical protein